MYHFRREKIKDLVDQKKFVTIKELLSLCPDVTLMTLHRDLNALQQAGFLQKMRGGVRAANGAVETSFYARSKIRLESKDRIAKKAAELVSPGASVFIDAGTTCLALVRALPDVDITVFTTGANFAPELSRLSRASVNMCCGGLNSGSMALSGHSTLEYLDGVNIDVCFLGVSGYSPGAGFTCGKESEMLVKKLAIKKARTSALLMDKSKTARIMPYTFASFSEIDYVFTDDTLPDEVSSEASEHSNARVIYC